MKKPFKACIHYSFSPWSFSVSNSKQNFNNKLWLSRNQLQSLFCSFNRTTLHLLEFFFFLMSMLSFSQMTILILLLRRKKMDPQQVPLAKITMNQEEDGVWWMWGHLSSCWDYPWGADREPQTDAQSLILLGFASFDSILDFLFAVLFTWVILCSEMGPQDYFLSFKKFHPL